MDKRILINTLFLISILSLLSCSTNNNEQSINKSAEAYVQAVMDGDTVRVKFVEEPAGCTVVEKVRLIGVNTSELYSDPPEYFAKEAYEFTDGNLWHKNVKIEFDEETSFRDRYGRLLAYVYVEGSETSFNEELLTGGYAEYYGYFKFNEEKMQLFKQCETTARNNKVGRWAKE